MLYVKNVHTTTISKTVTRLVKCEHCGIEFVYFMELEAEGRANSPYFLAEKSAKKSASQKAHRQMDVQVAKSFDSIPCPGCFLYQKYMYETARSGANSVSLFTGCSSLFLGCLLAGGLRILYESIQADWMWYAAVALMAIFLVPVAWQLAVIVKRSINFDPNTESEDNRKRIAQEQAVERHAFEKSIQTQLTNDLDELATAPNENANGDPIPFDVPFWIDDAQLDHDVKVQVSLPNGENVEIDIERDESEGARYSFVKIVGGRKIKFRCVLRTFTQPILPSNRAG